MMERWRSCLLAKCVEHWWRCSNARAAIQQSRAKGESYGRRVRPGDGLAINRGGEDAALVGKLLPPSCDKGGERKSDLGRSPLRSTSSLLSTAQFAVRRDRRSALGAGETGDRERLKRDRQ